MTKSAVEIKETGSHFTSFELSKFMAKKLLEYVELDNPNQEIVSVLDPSCGSGELLKAVCNEVGTSKLEVIGMDTDREAIQQANEYLSSIDNNNIHLFNGDYLELFENKVDLFSDIVVKDDFWCSSAENDDLKKVDMVIANPPYVRTQVLGAEKAQELAKKFNLKGKIDLYQVFLVAMTNHLKEDGLICVITSNRYLTTVGGKDIREFLNENYEIIEVIDLGDTKLFEAAVLPAIFIGRKKSNSGGKKNSKAKCFRIYEEPTEKALKTYDSIEAVLETHDSIYEILQKRNSGIYRSKDKFYKVTVGYLKMSEDPKEPWIMASKEDNEWSEKVKSNAKWIFDDVFKVRVGIKTTADSVFIRSDWHDLDESITPENEVLKPLISSDTASRWILPKEVENLKILYTHEVIDGKRKAIDLDKFPKAKAYLESHRERLEGRKYVIKAKRKWYEIWVPQDPEAWKSLKVVFPDISMEPKFAVDDKGSMVDGNCYWLSLRNEQEEDLLYLATVVANSKFMSKFHEIEFQNQLYAGRKRYLTQYVKNYPLPDPNSVHSKRLTEIGKLLTHSKLTVEDIKKYELEIESEVPKAFGF